MVHIIFVICEKKIKTIKMFTKCGQNIKKKVLPLFALYKLLGVCFKISKKKKNNFFFFKLNKKKKSFFYNCCLFFVVSIIIFLYYPPPKKKKFIFKLPKNNKKKLLKRYFNKTKTKKIELENLF